MNTKILYYTNSFFVVFASCFVFVLPLTSGYGIRSMASGVEDFLVAAGLVLYAISLALLALLVNKKVRDNLNVHLFNAGALSILVLSAYVILIPVYAISVFNSGL